MTFPIIGGGFNATAPVFPVQRSVRLRDSAPAYFNRTPASAGSRTTWTWSGWVKRGAFYTTNSGPTIFGAGVDGNNFTDFRFLSNTSDVLDFTYVVSGSAVGTIRTTQVFRDPSSWYHIVIAFDTTQATNTNRIRLYINGVQVTSFIASIYPAQNNAQCQINATNVHYIGKSVEPTYRYMDGYLTETNFINGYPTVGGTTYDATSWAALNVATLFGSYNIGTGVWQPIKYSGTYSTNGYYLNFQDNSGQTTSSNVGIGKDSSGNGNYWVSNGITLTPTTSASYDSMLDVPTNTSNTNANFCTANAVNTLNWMSQNGSMTYAGGNLNYSVPVQGAMGGGTIGVSSGKWYWEYVGSSNYCFCGILSTRVIPTGNGTYYYYQPTGVVYNYPYNSTSPTTITTLATFSSTDVIGIALNMDSLTMAIYKNGILLYTVTGIVADTYVPLIGGAATSTGGSVNFGQRPFSYPLAGYNMLCTYNLPTPLIPNGAAYMAATLWAGNNGTQSILNSTNNTTGVSFQPDLVWLKQRSPTGTGHIWEDSVRGALQYLGSEVSSAESTIAGTVTSFDSNGFSIGNQAGTNATGSTYVGWQWKASNAAAVTNTNGTIPSQVSANTTAGFSIVTYTGTTANATVGHGLNTVPSMIFVKNRDSGAIGGAAYHASIGATKYLQLFQTTTGTASATTDNTAWNGGSPTFNTSVFSVGALNRTNSAQRMVAYCWAEIPGYSKFGSFVGTGSGTTAPFVYCGFRPRWIMYKCTTAAENWELVDTSRNPYNAGTDQWLYPNLSNAEGTTSAGASTDILSNGFKLRGFTGTPNTSGATYIYAAFAENPFNYSLAR